MTSPSVTNDAVESNEGDVMIRTPVLAGKQVRLINFTDDFNSRYDCIDVRKQLTVIGFI